MLHESIVWHSARSTSFHDLSQLDPEDLYGRVVAEGLSLDGCGAPAAVWRLDERQPDLRVGPDLRQAHLVERAHGGEPTLILRGAYAELRRAGVSPLHLPLCLGAGRTRRSV